MLNREAEASGVSANRLARVKQMAGGGKGKLILTAEIMRVLDALIHQFGASLPSQCHEDTVMREA
jgi:hypothetical protein